MSSGDKSEKTDPVTTALQSAYRETVDEGVPDSFRTLIDENLKRAFDETIAEGVPDRFQTLMDDLRRAAETK